MLLKCINYLGALRPIWLKPWEELIAQPQTVSDCQVEAQSRPFKSFVVEIDEAILSMEKGKLKIQHCPHHVRLLLYPMIVGSLLFILGFMTLAQHITSEALYIIAGIITFTGGCLLFIGTCVCCKHESFFVSETVVEFIPLPLQYQQQNETNKV